VKKNIRKANSQVGASHTVAAFILHDAVQMQDERTQCGIVRVWEIVDLLVKRVPTGTWVVNSRRIDEGIVCPAGEQWVWQVAEELLEKGSHRVDIVVEVGRVAEVEVGSVVVECVTKGVNVRSCAGHSVNSFDFEAEEVDGLHTLVDDHGDCGLVTGEEFFQTDTENGARGCFVRHLGWDGEVRCTKRAHCNRVGGSCDRSSYLCGWITRAWRCRRDDTF